jgi:hypothetical protein
LEELFLGTINVTISNIALQAEILDESALDLIKIPSRALSFEGGLEELFLGRGFGGWPPIL